MKSVGVIGAGASGIITAKILKEKGFHVSVFEEKNHIGGVWKYNKDINIGSIYKSLKTNLPKESMVFLNSNQTYKSQFSYIDHQDVYKYLDDNIKSWGLLESIKFNTKVISIKPLNNYSLKLNNISSHDVNEFYVDNINNTKWKLKAIYNDNVISYVFDYIVICSGHFSKPNDGIKNINGQHNIKITHSKNYRSPDKFKGNIICVGNGASGKDISLELKQHGCNVYIAKKDIGIDEENRSLNRNIYKKNIYESYFISMPLDIINKNDKSLVITSYGNEIEVDHIILCTGYIYQYDFIKDIIKVSENQNVYPLYKDIIHTYYPSMAFIGLQKNILPFVLFEAQAEYISSLWLRNSIEDLSTRKTEIENRYKKSNYKDVHNIQTHHWNYIYDLYSFVGIPESYKSKLRLIQLVFDDALNNKDNNPYDYRNFNYNINYKKNKWSKTIDNTRSII